VVSAVKEKGDKHFPLFAYDNVLRRLFDPPQSLVERYVSDGQVVADLGCGPDYYTIALAESVGLDGKVYAVDSDENAIRAVERKAKKRGYENIETHTSSASQLNFIGDRAVDFVLAHGLLCSIAPGQRESALNEIKRILKPEGLAYISVARGLWSYVDLPAWEKILEGFKVEERHDGSMGFGERWAIVSTRRV
jgi:ubiquinone/menaquinone biosynthesis C-methylase UbiE